MISLLIIFILILALSGAFSGSESALFSLDKGKISRLTENHPGKSKILRYLLGNPEKTLSVILLGNLAVNVAISYLGNRIIEEYLPFEASEIFSLLSITMILLIFGEILPKVTAVRLAEKWSLAMSPFVFFWYRFAIILAWPIYLITNAITSLIPNLKHRIRERDLIDSVQDAQKEGILNSDEQMLLQRAVNFYYDTAYSVMIPRSQVNMVPRNATAEEAKKVFTENATSLLMVYNEQDGSIAGYLHIRNLIPLMAQKKEAIKKSVTQPLSFPATISLADLLGEFIKSKIEVAAILDEMGEFTGIVTMKEIFAKLMGELETPAQKPLMPKTGITPVRNKKNEYKVDGGITLDEFNSFFKTNISAESSETLSGFLIEKLDGFPAQNTNFAAGNLTFYKMKVENYKITSVRVAVRS